MEACSRVSSEEASYSGDPDGHLTCEPHHIDALQHDQRLATTLTLFDRIADWFFMKVLVS